MKLEMCRGLFAIRDCYTQKDFIKEQLGGTWSKKDNAWLVAPDKRIARTLKNMGASISQEVIDMFNTRNELFLILDSIKDRTYIPKDDFRDLFKSTVNNQPFKLMQHQILGASFATELFEHGYTGCMLSMEMGTGKTLTSIAMIARQYVLGNINKLLVVCPKIAMQVWVNEFKNFANFKFAIACLQGTQKQRLDKMNWLEEQIDCLKVVVINYEYVATFQAILEKWKPDFILCDESHRIKSVSTQQTKAVTKIGEGCKFRICLTGTPLTSNIIDFFSQYKFMDNTIFGLSITCYKIRYIITGMFGEYLRPNPEHFEELQEKINSIAYRVVKEECLQLPEYTDIPIYVDIGCMKQYKELEQDYITWLSENENISVSNALTQTLQLRQMTGGFYYTNDEINGKVAHYLDSSKLDACMDLIKDITQSGKKVIVFAEFQAEIERIYNKCIEAGYKCGTYYGKTKEQDKTNLVNGFQYGDIQVFIGQIESAGISITLTSASHMIFYSTGYKYGVYDQARARIHRKGQTNACTYYHLLARNTIDNKIMKALERKEALSSSIIDEYRKGE